jgi:hypothetical protein
MVIGILRLELHIPASNSLKHKRMILNSLKSRMRNNFNVSIAEVDGHDKWQRTTIAICYVTSGRKYIYKIMEKILNFIELFNGVDLLTHEMEIL